MSEGQKAGPYIQEHPGHVLPPAPGWYVMRYRPYSGGVVWTTGVIYYKAIGIQFNALTAA